MEELSLTDIINTEMNLELPPQLPYAEMRLRLQVAVSQMISQDFQLLINVLYRVDVNERKLKYLLQENVGEDASVIIADLILERQTEKISLRKKYSRPDNDISNEEKW